MAKRQDINDTIEKVLSVWDREGIGGMDLVDLQNDPVARLLLGAVNHQANILSENVDTFQNETIEKMVELCAPQYLMQPIPAIGMMQTGKRHKTGFSNNETTRIDDSVYFAVSNSASASGTKYTFIPLIEISVFDLTVRTVTQTVNNRWKVELEEKEPVISLEGLSLYMPGLHTSRSIRVYSEGWPIELAKISDFDTLPFVKPFLDGMRYSKNAMQFATLQNIHDNLCCHVDNYCVVIDHGVHQIHRQDGCIVIEIEIDEAPSGYTLHEDNLMVNCVPVINAEKNSTTLSWSHPIQRLDLYGKSIVSLLPVQNDIVSEEPVVLRSVGTERMSPILWMQQMKRLIDYYDSEYVILNEVLNPKFMGTATQFMSVLKETMKKTDIDNQSVYLVLRDKNVTSVDARWLTTDGLRANGLDKRSHVEVSTSELDSDKTRLVHKTMGGKDAIKDFETRKSCLQYWQLTRDRIVSKSDLILFCRFKLREKYGIRSESIRDMRIRIVVSNDNDGFYERVLVVEIVVSSDAIDDSVQTISSSLERMIATRNASTSKVRVLLKTE